MKEKIKKIICSATDVEIFIFSMGIVVALGVLLFSLVSGNWNAGSVIFLPFAWLLSYIIFGCLSEFTMIDDYLLEIVAACVNMILFVVFVINIKVGLVILVACTLVFCFMTSTWYISEFITSRIKHCNRK